MTVTTTTASVTYTGNGVATNFPFDFKLIDEDHLIVYRILISTGVGTLVTSAEYTLNGLGDETGGSIDYLFGGVALSSLYQLQISREVPYTQDLDVDDEGGFNAEVLEQQLDLMEMQIQQIAQLAQDAIDADGDITIVTGSGTEVTINGVAITGMDLDDADPAAPAAGVNVLWQKNTTPAPDSVSAYLPLGAGLAALAATLVPTLKRSAKTGNYTIIASDRGKVIELGTNAGTFSLTAAATLDDGFYCFVHNLNTTLANVLTIDPNGAELIDGVATLTGYCGSLIMLHTDGSAWYSRVIEKEFKEAFVTPAALNADTNDYAPTVNGDDVYLRISASTAIQITGLTGGAVRQVRKLVNVGTKDILLKHESASSTAANRFNFGSRSFILSPGKTVELWWDSTSSRWRPRTMPDRVVKLPLAADVTNNDASANTIADVTALSFDAIAGQAYHFRFVIMYDAAATTTGSRWSINGPAITDLAYRSSYSLTTTSETVNSGLGAYDLPAASNATSAATTDNMAVVEGTIIPSATGTVIARFASEVSASAIVAQALFSYVEYEAI